MNILDKISCQTKGVSSNNLLICIGLDNNPNQNEKIIRICKEQVKRKRIKIILFSPNLSESIKHRLNYNDFRFQIQTLNGSKDSNLKLMDFYLDLRNLLIRISDQFDDKNKINNDISNDIFLIQCKEPEIAIIGLSFYNNLDNYFKSLDSSESNYSNNVNLNKYRIAGIRGSLSSSKFLKILQEFQVILSKNGLFIKKKQREMDKNLNLTRIALLEDHNKHQFFYAPVGIDEARNLEMKRELTDVAIKILQLFNFSAKISVLSGGRIGDIGRDPLIDKSIQDTKELVIDLKQSYGSDIEIYDDEILIEKSVHRNSNFILAPDGISGNLIYRTLVHLGNGKAYGAIYGQVLFDHNVVLIDCSRVANDSEIMGSINLAYHLSYLL